MEIFMYAPVGVFAGRNNGDADRVSAPHSRQSIATCAGGGNPVWRLRRCSLTLLCSAPTLQLAMANIRIGPAGWSYSDWAGYVYPTPRPKGFHEATYLAQFFDTIEINTSFYQPLNPAHARQWLDRVSANPHFVFTAKLWQKFTHDPSATPEDERAVRAGFDILHKAGKLGAILLQFPFAFHRTAETIAYLDTVLKRFADYPLAVEVRHATWNDPEIFARLRERRVAFCNIDQPLIGRSLEPSEEITSSIGYIRLHGRRYDTW